MQVNFTDRQINLKRNPKAVSNGSKANQQQSGITKNRRGKNVKTRQRSKSRESNTNKQLGKE